MEKSPHLMPLDLARIERVRTLPGRIIGRCPACGEAGRDRTGNHLAVFDDGRFACAAHPEDRDHRRRIFALVGTTTERPARDQDRIARQCADDRRREAARHLAIAAARSRANLVEHHPWDLVDLWEDSPQRIDSDTVATCPRHFLGTLFPPDAILWSGALHESGTAHAGRWRATAAWENTDDRIGPMVTPSTWHSGTTSRSRAGVATAPFTVCDFDEMAGGRRPETPAELRQHVRESLAIIRWMRETLDWQLAAIIFTGGKSLHAWFRTPPPEVLQSLRDTAESLGIDAGLVGHPEHPCRLPGQIHGKTGRQSRVLWLQAADR